MSNQLTIGEVSAAAGVNASAIRYYERAGVLPEADRVGGQRRYGPEIVGRLRAIKAAQRAGFSLGEITELLRCDGDGRTAEGLRGLAEQKLAELEALMARTARNKGWLELATACDCASLQACQLFAE